MTDKVILPLANGCWLALDPETFQKGLLAGSELLPERRIKSVNEEQWLTIKQVAERTGVSTSHWYEECRTGRCPSHKFGTAVRIPASHLADIEA